MEYNIEIEDLLPHLPPMRLIENTVEITSEMAHCQTTTSQTGVLAPFLTPLGLPNWIAVELIAQTIAIWNTYQDIAYRKAPSIGFLLGGRSIEMLVNYFKLDLRLDIYINKITQNEKLACFHGSIYVNNERMLHGSINVYQPNQNEINQIIKGVF